MKFKEFFSFKANKFFWLNLLGMLLVAILLLWGTLRALDIYTRHGMAVEVPDAKGMTVSEAQSLFRSRGLSCLISDSIYVKEKPLGTILDVTPPIGQRVKEGRTVYLTINTANIPLYTFPDIADNSSLRQAEARVKAAGFKLTEHEFKPGEKDWVYGVKYNGKELEIGEKVPAGATVTLMVGDGTEELTDSLGLVLNLDSLPVKSDETLELDGESWF